MARNPSNASCRKRRRRFEALAIVAMLAVAGCAVGEEFTRGQKITPEQLEQVPIGSSREQVLLALGTPTTTGLMDGEAFYYISQVTGRTFAFQKNSVRDRRILVVYLDDNQEVRDLAEYGLKDGRVFDYLSRKTATGGGDIAFVSQILGGLVNPGL